MGSQLYRNFSKKSSNNEVTLEALCDLVEEKSQVIEIAMIGSILEASHV
jgi:hypothetical protein